MRVLMFGWEFPPHISGGLGTACQGIVGSLLERNVNVVFVVPKAYGDEPLPSGAIIGAEGTPHKLKELPFGLGSLLHIGVSSSLAAYPSFRTKVEEVVEPFHGVKSSLSTDENSFRFSGGYGANLVEEVEHFASIGARIAREQPFDVIHAHDWPTFPAGIVAKRIARKPLVVHVHATELDRSGGAINKQVYAIEKMGVDEADMIICVSNLTKNKLINFYHADERKIEVVHNGVMPNAYESIKEPKLSPKEDRIVAYLGRITYQKGPAFFVDAAKKVLDFTKNVRFVMAGDGDMLPEMVERVARYRIGDRFHFTGFLRGKEVAYLLNHTDVFVMTSVSEPFGIVPLEAMQLKVPVVLSKQSGVAEVLKYVIKVDFWDVDALADAIYGLVEYPALHSFLSSNGYAETKRLTWDDAAAKIERCYQKVVGRVA